MHAVYIHIDEALNARQRESVSSALWELPHVTDVELNPRLPHDVLIEYHPHPGMPMGFLHCLSRLGLHADVMAC